MSNCAIKLSPLTEDQDKKFKSNWNVTIPKGRLQIEFHNEIIGSGDIDTSIEMKKGN